MNDDQENEMTYDPQPEPEGFEGEEVFEKPKEKKSKKRKRKNETSKSAEHFSAKGSGVNFPKVIDQKIKEDGTIEGSAIKVRALKNFMLWDKTMVRQGEVVEVSLPYAERLLTHTPKAFVRA